MSSAPVAPTPASAGPALVAPATKAKAVAVCLMETVVNRDVLLAEIAAAHGITSSKTTIPILSNLLIEANDGSLSITASNLEQTLRTKAQAQVKKAGNCTVPARKFLDYIKLLPAGDISIKLLENSWVQIRAGRSTTKMVGMARDNYPQVPSPSNLTPVVIPVSVLRSLIAHTIFAVSSEEQRYVLNAALLLLEPKKISMVATDGHRLAVAEKDEHAGLSGVTTARKLLIPVKALHDLVSLLGSTGAESVELFEDATTIFFSLGLREFSTRKMTGNFPNYAAVVPTQNRNTLIVRATDFERSVRRVAQFADEKSSGVKLNIASNSLKLASSSVESGESEDTIDFPYKAEPVAIKLNSEYLLDFCKAVGGAGEVKMSFKDGTSAGLLEPEVANTETRFLYVIMPQR
jgi:DNA polymerase III subunit beta